MLLTPPNPAILRRRRVGPLRCRPPHHQPTRDAPVQFLLRHHRGSSRDRPQMRNNCCRAPRPAATRARVESYFRPGPTQFLSGTNDDIIHLIQTERSDLELQESWELSAGRLECLVPIGKALLPVRAAMKRMLLATIHRFYLKPPGSLPSDQLTHKYHRGILLGGYCYGPLDPVENIIVNSIWYEQNFPISKRFGTSMISTSCLWLVAARSMYGLVSFLCACYPLLTPDMQHLLVAGANLRIADPNLFDKPSDEELNWSESPQIGSGVDTAFIQRSVVHKMAVHATVPEAYVAAAVVAFHPSPDAQIHFLASQGCV